MPEMDVIIARAEAFWAQATRIWIAGDWGMLAIAVNAFVLFALGAHIWLRLRGTGLLNVPERRWRRWIDDPSGRKGTVGEILDQATSCRSLSEVSATFDAVRTIELAPFERDLRVMKICVGTATLLGLFAQGISEALITTETGLVVALPGLFFHHQLSRRFERTKAMLQHMETICARHLHRRQREVVAASDPEPSSELRRDMQVAT
jgi:biopolymer transport protein ExbB